MNANCVLCGESVPLYAQSDHLRFKHPAPAGGFVFWMDEKRYTTDKPSMTVGEVISLTGASALYAFFQEHKDGDVQLTHGNAVDLTQSPHFYTVPPATW